MQITLRAIKKHFRFSGKMKWAKVVPYMIAQYFGAFTGASVVYMTYKDALSAFHNINTEQMASAGIFATYPSYFISTTTGFIDQVSFGS